MTGQEKGEPREILIMLACHWVELSIMKKMKIAIDIRDRAAEGRTYGSLGNAYDSLGVWSSPGQFIRPSSFFLFSLMTLITLRAFLRLVSSLYAVGGSQISCSSLIYSK